MTADVKRAALALAVAILCGSALVSVASARKPIVKTYPTYLLVSHIPNASGASGKINSTKASCKSGRKVQIVLDDTTVAGSTTTEADGSWAISASLGDTGFAQVIVKARTKSFRKNGKLHKDTCKEARSTHYPL